SVDDDLLAGRRQPPSADTLSGYYADPSEPNFVMPGRARLKRPVPSASVEIATEISRWLTDKRWNDLVTAQNSALFETPVKHFIVKAFWNRTRWTSPSRTSRRSKLRWGLKPITDSVVVRLSGWPRAYQPCSEARSTARTTVVCSKLEAFFCTVERWTPRSRVKHV